jgi:hypothetical protein
VYTELSFSWVPLARMRARVDSVRVKTRAYPHTLERID